MAESPLNVVMVNKYYPPHVGGIEFHLRDLAEGLVAQGRADVKVLVCNAENRRIAENINGVSVTRLPRAAEFASTPISWGFARELRALASASPRPDLFHFHFPYPWGELAWLAARLDVPMVVSYHSDIVRQKAALVAYRPFMERFVDSAELIIAGSPQMVQYSPVLNPRRDRCRQVNYGLHVERFAGDENTKARAVELRARYADRPLVLFVGRLVYYKGADVMVRAMADVDAQLVMIGKGPLEAELREIAAACGISQRVDFVSGVDDDELAAWYHAADVFALPSVANSEAFGLVQIEAHAAGTPVVSTDLPTGVPYANLNEQTGLIVPVGDVEALSAALNRLLSDDELRTRLGAQARERALSDFTIPRMVGNIASVYAEAVDLWGERRGRRQ